MGQLNSQTDEVWIELKIEFQYMRLVKRKNMNSDQLEIEDQLH